VKCEIYAKSDEEEEFHFEVIQKNFWVNQAYQLKVHSMYKL